MANIAKANMFYNATFLFEQLDEILDRTWQ